MHVLKVRNVQQALPEGIALLRTQGIQRDSRNGPVVVIDGPVTTLYQKPNERVIFYPERDANPFFHLFESLWMLAGRNDVSFVTQFVKRMQMYSDDGVSFHGAYGYRWIHFFGFNQLETVIKALKENPNDRRCVVGMWSPADDLGVKGKDVPCNTQIYFSINFEGKLDMTVCNRSNDVIWGAYGANAVHFSFLQEYMAYAIGVGLGRYWQISNNYHAYLETYNPLVGLSDMALDPFRKTSFDPYEIFSREVPLPIISTHHEEYIQDINMFLEHGPIVGLRDPFLRKVATPMWNAYFHYKETKGEERFEGARKIMSQCKDFFWTKACLEWLERRQIKARKKLEKAQDDGPNYD